MTPVDAASALDSATSNTDFEMPAPGTPGYLEFRKTGKLPEREASAPQTVEPVTEEGHEEEIPETESEIEGVSATPVIPAEPAAAPAAAPTQRKKDAAARLQEVLAERRKDRELIRQLTEKLTGTPSVAPHSQAAAEPEAKPATTAKPKPKSDDVDAQGKPMFKTWAEYEDARDEYNRGELMRLVDERQNKVQQTQGIAEAEKIVNQVWGSRVQEARKQHADYDTVVTAAVNAKDEYGRDLFFLPKGSAPDSFLLDSDLGSEVLYYLGQHIDETKHIFERNAAGEFLLNPIRQVRELAKIENMIEQSRAAITAPKPPVSTRPPARPITQAPPPPHQVSGKGPTPDRLETAVKEGDFVTFQREENARILAQRKRR